MLPAGRGSISLDFTPFWLPRTAAGTGKLLIHSHRALPQKECRSRHPRGGMQFFYDAAPGATPIATSRTSNCAPQKMQEVCFACMFPSHASIGNECMQLVHVSMTGESPVGDQTMLGCCWATATRGAASHSLILPRNSGIG